MTQRYPPAHGVPRMRDPRTNRRQARGLGGFDERLGGRNARGGELANRFCDGPRIGPVPVVALVPRLARQVQEVEPGDWDEDKQLHPSATTRVVETPCRDGGSGDEHYEPCEPEREDHEANCQEVKVQYSFRLDLPENVSHFLKGASIACLNVITSPASDVSGTAGGTSTRLGYRRVPRGPAELPIGQRTSTMISASFGSSQRRLLPPGR